MKFTLDPANRNVARTGMQIDVARTTLFHFDIAAARASPHRAGYLSRPHIARPGLQADISGEIRQLHVPRPRLQFSTAAKALNGLVSRAATGAQGRVSRDSNVVVDRNITHVHVV